MEDSRSWVNQLRYAWAHRWRGEMYAPDEVPCVLAGVEGTARVAPSTLSFIRVRRGPLGISYVDPTDRRIGISVDHLDKGHTSSVVYSQGTTLEWTVPDIRLATWAFDIADSRPGIGPLPQRPPLLPPGAD